MRAFRWRSFAAGLSSHSRQSPTNSSPEWGRGAKVLVPWSPNSGRNRWVKSGLLCGVCCSGWPPFHQPLVRCPLTRRRQRLCSTQVVKNSLNKALYNAMYDSQNLHGRSTEVLNLIHATHHTTNQNWQQDSTLRLGCLFLPTTFFNFSASNGCIFKLLTWTL